MHPALHVVASCILSAPLGRGSNLLEATASEHSWQYCLEKEKQNIRRVAGSTFSAPAKGRIEVHSFDRSILVLSSIGAAYFTRTERCICPIHTLILHPSIDYRRQSLEGKKIATNGELGFQSFVRAKTRGARPTTLLLLWPLR
jgi:hypothetical protein